MKIPGLSFSWKRALGVTQAKREFSRATGIPTTKAGLERKVGKMIIDAVIGGKKRSRRWNGQKQTRMYLQT